MSGRSRANHAIAAAPQITSQTEAVSENQTSRDRNERRGPGGGSSESRMRSRGTRFRAPEPLDPRRRGRFVSLVRLLIGAYIVPIGPD